MDHGTEEHTIGLLLCPDSLVFSQIESGGENRRANPFQGVLRIYAFVRCSGDGKQVVNGGAAGGAGIMRLVGGSPMARS